jgi:dihydroorotase
VEEGCYADLVLLENVHWQVDRNNILYKCGWSPLEGMQFNWRAGMVTVSGTTVFENGLFTSEPAGMRIAFTNR